MHWCGICRDGATVAIVTTAHGGGLTAQARRRRPHGRRMEAVAKLGRARFSSMIRAKKSLHETHCVGGTFFEGRVFGGSATASMRRPYAVLPHRAATWRHRASAVTPSQRRRCRHRYGAITAGGCRPQRNAIAAPLPHLCCLRGDAAITAPLSPATRSRRAYATRASRHHRPAPSPPRHGTRWIN